MRARGWLQVAFFALAGSLYADTAKFTAFVMDESTGLPIPGVTVRANFAEDIGWRAWTESPTPDVDIQVTDDEGRCRLKGKTNCGNVCCWVAESPPGYYVGHGWGHTYGEKNFFGVWQPDDLVATIRLQRVENPIPLFVKHVELRDYEYGIGGFDGTNAVLRFDLMKGDWLPPYGEGETADMQITSEVKITDKEQKFRYASMHIEEVFFYDLCNDVCFGGEDDFVQEAHVEKTAGIKVRMADGEGSVRHVTRIQGKKKTIVRDKDWHCKYFSNEDANRCYTFRIRSKINEAGELVEAYYGKIYGDFEFEGDGQKGLIGVKFLYYLNPKPLDRNLEWDMKTNLCPDPGTLSKPQP